jgi:hypothetical protein
VFILGNGAKDKNMDMGNFIFLIKMHTLGSLIMVRLKVKEDYFILMEIFILVIGKMIKLMDLVGISLETKVYFKGDGLMINDVVMENNHGLMVQYLKGNIKTTKKMGKVDFVGQMAINI